MRGLLCSLVAGAAMLIAQGHSAADSFATWSDFQERRWSVLDGLPQATVWAMAQASDRYMWIATEGGVVIFDGASFQTISPEGKQRFRRARALLVDSKQNLWAGVLGGAGLLQQRRTSLLSMRHRLPEGMNSVIAAHEDSRGQLWLGTWWGPMKAPEAQSNFQRVAGAPTSSVWAIAEAPEGTLWLGTREGLYRHDLNGTADAWSKVDIGLSAGTSIRALARDKAGALWIGTIGEGVLRWQNGAVRRFTTADNLPHDAVRALFFAKDGVLWIGTQDGAARLWKGQVYPAPDGTGPWQDVMSFAEDHEGNIWMGTRGGLARLALGAARALAVPGPVEHHGSSGVLVARDGTVWMGIMGGGLAWRRDNESGIYGLNDGLCVSLVLALWEDQTGAVWVGGEEGARGNLCSIDKSGGIRTLSHEDGFAVGQPVRTIREDKLGRLLVGTDGGFYVVENHRAQAVPIAPDRPRDSARVEGRSELGVWSLESDGDGCLWVGTTKGLFRRCGDKWLIPGVGPANPPFGMVYSIQTGHSQDTWFGTIDGLGRFTAAGFKQYGPEEGLPSAPVHRVIDDGDAHVFLCTPRGILRVAKNELNDVDAGKRASVNPRLFDETDGIKDSGCGEEGAGPWKGSDGRLYFPTSQGVSWMDPRQIPSPPAPKILITSAVLDGHDVSGGDVTVPAGRGDLKIDFSAPSFLAPERLAFRFRLEPLDVQDKLVERQYSAHYAALPPGDYRFVISVRGSDGRWSALATTLTFTLDRHLHQRPEFFALAITVLVLCGLAIGHFLQVGRMRRIRMADQAVMAERGRMARELHDSLAQGLTGIAVQLETAVMRLDGAPAKARLSLDKARALVRMSLSEARRAVWNLRQPELVAGDLPSAVAQQATQSGIEIPVRLQVNGQVRRLPEQQETNLVRIVQESLTNAARHAKASSVVVELSFDSDAVRLSVRDDGVGFHQGELPPGHFGITGMKERAREADIDLQIHSRPGGGTEVKATVFTT